MMLTKLILILGFVPWLVQSLASTDSISDADPAQSGYLPNHNMDPSIVGSPIFGILWQNTYLNKEKWYAKPLVYTPTGGKQLVFIASTLNYIRTLDAVTGALIKERQVQPPFLQSDIGCTDIPDYIGIVGTPIIDPSTDTVYFFSKGYKDGGAIGVGNGIYKFYAVNINDLTDRPGFPILMDGHNADNDPSRYFLGGTVLQRPALALIGGVVYGAFGGHCDKYNYTGMLIGVSTTPNVGIVTFYAMESSPYAPAVVSDFNVEQGGKAGIWMSGMAPATDGQRIFVTTGNGQGHQNKETPASGRSLLQTLDEVVANFAIGPGGKVTLQDYFEPYEYVGMDAGDRDLGSGGTALLDPAVFKGTNGIKRLAATIGKNGKCYITNADNLGGFRNGPGATDNVVQTIVTSGAVFGGVGSYPLEGGYIYFTPVGSPTLVYAMGLDQNGNPLFSKVGESPDTSAGRVGVGVPTITTYKGQAGTGIVWVTDVDGGLKAYKAVPDANGKLVKITIPPSGGSNKFQRPAFGDGRLYITDNNRHVTCMGSPVALPLNCSSPVSFGDVGIGSSATAQVNCTALIPITKIEGVVSSDAYYKVSNASLPQGALAQGATFSFPVTWDLSQATLNPSPGGSYTAVTPGVKSGTLIVLTTNGIPKYSTQYPIALQGNTVSTKPFLQVSPIEVDFGGLVVGGPGAASGLDSTFIISNLGKQTLTIAGFAYAQDLDAPIDWTNVTKTGSISQVGPEFTSNDFPAVGVTLAPGDSFTVPINFKSSVVGSYHNILQFWSDGGDQNLLMTGSATTAPIANISTENSEGYFDPAAIMDFGQVMAGLTVTRRIRLCNEGGSSLLITKSKPPIQAELRATNPSSDLHEGQFIDVNSCAYGPVAIAATPSPPNMLSHDVSDVWILNTDDLNFGVHEIPIKATIVTRQLGPLNADGTARYRYLGCYADGSGRQLQKSYNLGANNENDLCQKTCLQNGYRFAGTEYHVECWCGNNPPTALKYSPGKCTWACAADSTQPCGGDGTYINIFYDTTKYTPDCSAVPCDGTSTSTTLPVVASSTVPATDVTPPVVATTTAVVATTPAAPVPTGPIVNPGNADYSSIGCYADGLTKSINPNTKYATDLMTVQICLDFCKSKGSTYAGIEYRRECYCGNALASDAIANSAGCTLTCFANATEYCGGSKKMNVYQAIVPGASSSTTAPVVIAPTTTTVPQVVTTPDPVVTTTVPPVVTTPDPLVTTTAAVPATTAPSTTATATAGFNYVGCFAEPLNGKAMVKIIANDSMSVEFCISAAQAKKPAVTYAYIGVEYGRECYGAVAPPASQTSLVGNKACTLACMGNTTQKCGGRAMYNYYATTTATVTYSGSTVPPTSTTGTIAPTP